MMTLIAFLESVLKPAECRIGADFFVRQGDWTQESRCPPRKKTPLCAASIRFLCLPLLLRIAIAVLAETSGRTRKPPAGNLNVISAGVLSQSVDTPLRGTPMLPVLFLRSVLLAPILNAPLPHVRLKGENPDLPVLSPVKPHGPVPGGSLVPASI